MKSPFAIEPLETRIAPATLTGNVLTYTDIDGDHVAVTFSHGTIDGMFFQFDTGVGVTGDNSMKQQLQLIDISSGTAGLSGTDVTMKVTKAGDGDGLAALGRINAGTNDLGKVTIQGDLASLTCGSFTATAGLKFLSVASVGRYGMASQGGGGGLGVEVNGLLGGLNITGDIVNASVTVTADITSVTIGGSLIGGANGGAISGSGEIGPVKIGGDVQGGSASVSGSIGTDGGGITSATIGGSLIGGVGSSSGVISSKSNLGPVKIGHDVLGGVGQNSGKIDSLGGIASVTVGGSIIGGIGKSSGKIFTNSNDIGAVKIGHDLVGGSGDESGKIDSGGGITSVNIGGSLIGRGGNDNTFTDGNMVVHFGQIFAVGDIGAVTIGHDVLGGAGATSALIGSHAKLLAATIGGSLIGGAGVSSGELFAQTGMGPVKIGLDVRGGPTGSGSGLIESDGGLTSVTIGGSLIGGAGASSGKILTQGGGDIGMVKIGGDLLGGTATSAGFINCAGSITGGVSIGGSLVGGSAANTGEILAVGAIGPVSIGRDFVGASLATGAAALDKSGYIQSGGRIASVFVGGSIVAGIDASNAGDLTHNASIRAADDIGSLTVKGSLSGHRSTTLGNSLIVISARGQHQPLPSGATTDVAIGKITIGGRVENTNLLAGYDIAGAAMNADAQIGPVKVGADWIASNLVAGAMNDAGTVATTDDNVNFGDDHDLKIAGGAMGIDAKITSITIGGQVFGSPEGFFPSDHFGFVAEQIGAFKIGSHAFSLPGVSNTDLVKLGFAPLVGQRDVNLHETLAVIPSTVTNAVPAAQRLDSSTLAYTDTDGDHVKVKLSKPLLTDDTIANSVFTFDQGDVGGPDTFPQQLQRINLGALATNGVSVTITVTPGGSDGVINVHGDGLANVGAITLGTSDAGNITLPGDLGLITGGASAGTQSVAALKVRSMGRLGLDAEPPASGTFTPSLQSGITGSLGSLTVKQDLAGALVSGGTTVGAVIVGGSLVGAGSDVQSNDGLGLIKVARDVEGLFATDGGIAGVTIGGSLRGSISCAKDLGPVKIGGNVLGSAVPLSGSISAGGLPALIAKIGGINIGGSLLGVAGNTGHIYATGEIGTVKVGGNVKGEGTGSGLIYGEAKVTSVTIAGSLIGGAGQESGQIYGTTHLGPVKIGRNVIGGAGNETGDIESDDTIDSVTIGGSLIDGSPTAGGNQQSGQIFSQNDLGPVKIGRNVLGGAAGDGGFIESSTGKFKSLSIGGSLIGGAGQSSGEVFSQNDLGPVKIGHNVLGGANESGVVNSSGGKIASVSIGGSVVGGSGSQSGEIRGNENVGAVKIGHNFVGGSVTGTATADSSGLIQSFNGRIASVTIGGSIIAGTDDSTMNQPSGDLTESALISAGDDLGSLTVKGSLAGNVSPNGTSRVTISARGQEQPTATKDVAIGKISIGGRVELADILAGTLGSGNGNAQIGSVKVGGAWSVSNLVAGAFDQGSNGFGNGDDQIVNTPTGAAADSVIARIASITIKGIVAGLAGPGHHFGFVAQQIGSFKAAGFTASLSPGHDLPIELSPLTGDMTLREL